MPNTYYVSPTGDNAHDGRDRSTPFQTLRRATEVLAPGDTAILLPGEYRIEAEYDASGRWVLAGLHGTASAPITIKGESNPRGQQPTTFTGVFPEFLHPDPGSAPWLFQPQLSGEGRNIYRSTRSYFLRRNASNGTKTQEIRGWLDETFSLVSYKTEDWDSFVSDNLEHKHIAIPGQNKIAEYVPNYVGPGIYVKPVRPEEAGQTGLESLEVHLYIRLDRTPTMRFLDEAMQLNLNASHDPNQHALRIGLLLDELQMYNCSWLRIENLRFYWPGRLSMIDHKNFPSPQDIHIENCLFKGFMSGGAGLLSSGRRAYGLNLVGLKLSGGYPPWVYWTDTKHGPSNGIASHFTGNCIALLGPETPGNPPSRTRVHNCYIKQAFFGISIPYFRHDVEISACNFHHIHDDAILLHARAHNIHIHHNLIARSFAGISASAGRHPSPPQEDGKVWIHHNIISTGRIAYGRKRFVGRPGDESLNANYMNTYIGYEDNRFPLPTLYRFTVGGFQANRPFGKHGNKAEPWNVYNNTLITDGQSGSGALQSHPDATAAYFFLNNIFLHRFDRGFFYRTVELGLTPGATGRKVSDGNLVWRPAPPDPDNRSDRSFCFEMYINGAENSWFSGLDHFRESAHFEASRTYHDFRHPSYGTRDPSYGAAHTGLDANSQWAHPGLDLSAVDDLNRMENYLQDYELLQLNLGFLRPPSGSLAGERRINIEQLAVADSWPERDSPYIGAKAPVAAGEENSGCVGQLLRLLGFGKK